LSYQYFLQAVEIFKSKQHLTLDGIEQLRAIRKKMNKLVKNQASARVRETVCPVGREVKFSDELIISEHCPSNQQS
jgi:flagellar hook assembly protein FlgD